MMTEFVMLLNGFDTIDYTIIFNTEKEESKDKRESNKDHGESEDTVCLLCISQFSMCVIFVFFNENNDTEVYKTIIVV